MTRVNEDARSILRANDRGGYTVPTDRLYPFQWNWDSGFVSLGWATFDEDRAWRELERLLEGQWADGMVPHIVFHAPSDDYFPGPEVWGSSHRPATSGITQPPILATIVQRIHHQARNRAEADERASALYPRLLSWHRWWAQARDPRSTGLVAILHPWESGRDNSPDWDWALARVPDAPSIPVRRRDTRHVRAEMRPRDEEYRRYVALVDLFRSLDWQADALWKQAPFKVADVGVNSILHRAETDLLELAQRFGTASERIEIAIRLERQRDAVRRLWSADDGVFQSLDLIAEKRIITATSAGFLPLFAALADEQHARRMAAVIERWSGPVRFMVPSLSPFDHRFEPKRYWRGPVWAIVNYMISEGFARYGEHALADRIRDDTRVLIHRGGFAEYFDPTTGQGMGGERFSWTAAMALAWATG